MKNHSKPPKANIPPAPRASGVPESLLREGLPKNTDAERCVIGAILQENSYLAAVANLLTPEDFWLGQHQVIFRCILEMEVTRQAIDPLTLPDELKRRGELEAAGGIAYVSAITDGVPRVINAPHYAGIVKECSQLRGIIHLTDSAQQMAIRRERVSDVHVKVTEGLAGILESALTGQGAVHVADIAKETLPRIELAASGGKIAGTPTGFSWLDATLAGWVGGEYSVLAARPSQGKSALAIKFLLQQGLRKNAAHMFSLEMGRQSVLLRMACLMARVDSHKLRTGRISGEELRELTEALSKIADMPIWVDDQPGLRATEIRRRAIAHARRHETKLVVVDYLQLARAQGKDLYEQVTAVSKEMQAVARDLGEASGGHLLALAQLNRLADKRRPRLTDLRDSGSIEQDADTVMFIYTEQNEKEAGRIEELEDDETRGQKKPFNKILDIAKQRNGPTEFRSFLFVPRWMDFVDEKDLAEEMPEGYRVRADEDWLETPGEAA